MSFLFFKKRRSDAFCTAFCKLVADYLVLDFVGGNSIKNLNWMWELIDNWMPARVSHQVTKWTAGIEDMIKSNRDFDIEERQLMIEKAKIDIEQIKITIEKDKLQLLSQLESIKHDMHLYNTMKKNILRIASYDINDWVFV